MIPLPDKIVLDFLDWLNSELYFKGNPMIYGSILAGLPLFGAVLHFIIYRKGNSN